MLDSARRELREVNMARPGENVCVRLASSTGTAAATATATATASNGSGAGAPRSSFAAAGAAGSVICAASDSPCFTAASFLVQLSILELPDTVPLITAGFACVAHLHTAVAECTVDQLLVHDTGRTKIKHPPFVKSFAQVLVKLDVSGPPVAVDTAERTPVLGHLTLRGHGRTLAFGRVVRVLVLKKRPSYP